MRARAGLSILTNEASREMNVSRTPSEIRVDGIYSWRERAMGVRVYIYDIGCAPFVTAANVQKWFVSFLRNARGAKSSVKGHHFRMRGENKSLAPGIVFIEHRESMLLRETFDPVRYLLPLLRIFFFFFLYTSRYSLLGRKNNSCGKTSPSIRLIDPSAEFPRNRKRRLDSQHTCISRIRT